jgi:predicted transposase/invertase (TIGR01784 family)
MGELQQNDGKIGSIVKNEKEKTIEITADGHGVRLDVYFEDDKNHIYDIEMQTVLNDSIPKRSRYYQGMMDQSYLKRSTRYEKLPESYIVFICTFDLFGRGYHKYSFIPMCREVDKLRLEDGTNRIFICDGGAKEDVSKEMKQLINYIAGRPYESDLASRINAEVQDAILQDKWRTEYMSFLNAMLDSFEDGKREGIEQGLDLHLIKQICKKLSKGEDPETIADEVEEPLERVKAICDIASGYAPDYEPEEILNQLMIAIK